MKNEEPFKNCPTPDRHYCLVMKMDGHCVPSCNLLGFSPQFYRMYNQEGGSQRTPKAPRLFSFHLSAGSGLAFFFPPAAE